MQQKEDNLTKLAENLEKRNLKFQQDKQLIREKTSEIDLWTKEAEKEEEQIKKMRLQMVRRKEMASKKEINLVEWTKRNAADKSKISDEKQDL